MAEATSTLDGSRTRATKTVTDVETRIRAHNANTGASIAVLSNQYNQLVRDSDKLRKAVEQAQDGKARASAEDAYLSCIKERAQYDRLLRLARTQRIAPMTPNRRKD